MSTITRNSIRPALKRPIVPVQSNISTASKNGAVQLQIISQPETQHRARYCIFSSFLSSTYSSTYTIGIKQREAEELLRIEVGTGFPLFD